MFFLNSTGLQTHLSRVMSQHGPAWRQGPALQVNSQWSAKLYTCGHENHGKSLWDHYHHVSRPLGGSYIELSDCKNLMIVFLQLLTDRPPHPHPNYPNEGNILRKDSAMFASVSVYPNNILRLIDECMTN